VPILGTSSYYATFQSINMAGNLIIKKVATLPTTLSPNTLYCIRSNNKLVLHLSDNNGELIYSTYDYNELVELIETTPADLAVVNIFGPNELAMGTTGTYEITNYDYRANYNVIPYAGSVTIEDNTIFYKAPLNLGLYGFTINGHIFPVNVTEPGLKTPSIIKPINNSLDQLEAIIIFSSDFKVIGDTDEHVATSWQLAIDSEFNNIVSESLLDTINKKTWAIGNLTESSIYYLRVKHHGTKYSESNWSSSSKFTTRSYFYPIAEFSKIVPLDGKAYDNFGINAGITLDDNVLVIGAYGVNSFNGAIYVYNRIDEQWIYADKLIPTSSKSNDYFGYAGTINSDGTIIVAGAYGDDDINNGAGAIYVYKKGLVGWTLAVKLYASDAATGDNFGFSAAISRDGNTIITSAPNDDSIRGAGYVFFYNGTNWSQQAKLTASDRAANDRFGFSVAISKYSDTIIIGANGDDSSRGSAYVFQRTNGVWVQEAKLLASDGVAGDNFGYSVATSCDGNAVMVGAPNKDNNKGAVYVFKRSGSTWLQNNKFIAPDGAIGDAFGTCVSSNATGNIFAVSAINDDDKGTDSGSVYVYDHSDNSWDYKAKLVASDGAVGDKLGQCCVLSCDGGNALVGAIFDSPKGTASGALYVFR
jgi:hypothetical protein